MEAEPIIVRPLWLTITGTSGLPVSTTPYISKCLVWEADAHAKAEVTAYMS